MKSFNFSFTKTVTPKKMSYGTPLNKRFYELDGKNIEDEENEENATSPKSEKEEYED